MAVGAAGGTKSHSLPFTRAIQGKFSRRRRSQTSPRRMVEPPIDTKRTTGSYSAGRSWPRTGCRGSSRPPRRKPAGAVRKATKPAGARAKAAAGDHGAAAPQRAHEAVRDGLADPPSLPHAPRRWSGASRDRKRARRGAALSTRRTKACGRPSRGHEAGGRRKVGAGDHGRLRRSERMKPFVTASLRKRARRKPLRRHDTKACGRPSRRRWSHCPSAETARRQPRSPAGRRRGSRPFVPSDRRERLDVVQHAGGRHLRAGARPGHHQRLLAVAARGERPPGCGAPQRAERRVARHRRRPALTPRAA